MKTVLIAAFLPLAFLAAALPAPVPGGSSEAQHHSRDGNSWHGGSLSAPESVTRSLSEARDLHATEVEGEGVHEVHPTEDWDPRLKKRSWKGQAASDGPNTETTPTIHPDGAYDPNSGDGDIWEGEA
ncbi:hypothetical protein C7999DRAFT_33302 [Corynascus novoguineensis]|uniref:Uncharacterized protein n=1 Tax=Corynascus novoguineensis TaxID=1126955 RepID=A0AAN7HNP6_9PEZI|nr:hypothetical protein C7999DRAFT_33302 [Corynascus novoguineensis]